MAAQDEFQGEYVAAYAERLRWLSGFAGSWGLAIVTARKAAIFVDGRYTLQVREQVDRGAERIIVAGGDGSVHEAVNGILKAGTDAALGLIPLGTGNDFAKAVNLPQDNIKRAIMKGTGELQGQSFEEIAFEGYGPGGVAVLVETVTDNRNRTASEVRTAFSKHGGSLGETNSVSFMFERVGIIALRQSHLAFFRSAGERDHLGHLVTSAMADHDHRSLRLGDHRDGPTEIVGVG